MVAQFLFKPSNDLRKLEGITWKMYRDPLVVNLYHSFIKNRIKIVFVCKNEETLSFIILKHNLLENFEIRFEQFIKV